MAGSRKRSDPEPDCYLLKPFPLKDALKQWPQRYKSQSSEISKESCEEEDIQEAKCHYKQAMVEGVLYNIGDDAYVKADDGNPNYIARIMELFETVDGGEPYFTAQWFYRMEDTLIKDYVQSVENRRVFLSEIKDDNPLDCIVSKVKIALVAPNTDLALKEKNIPRCDLYYDMKYSLPFQTFATVKSVHPGSFRSNTNNCNGDVKFTPKKTPKSQKSKESKMYLLDLFSGCGAMSTGLCMGASLSGVKLVTRWAVDINSFACKSLKVNHSETEVRNEAAEDFLSLLKEWEKLCKKFSLLDSEKQIEPDSSSASCIEEQEEEDGHDTPSDPDNFVVEKLVAVCYGDPNKVTKRGLYFKVRWEGYGPSEDTWEPIDGLSNCMEKLKEFVTRAYRSKLLPLPGDADFICGGPPCQGVSGFNRFRNTKAPLDDLKNRQLVVFMDIVEYLKPKYVLMENVVDILKLADGILGRYAIGRLVSMNYQARLGMMAAGSFGLPQFRMRVFLWGAQPSELLPRYPLPTHEVAAKGGIATEFEEIVVAYDKDKPQQLQKALYLGDVISDLPSVTNDENEDERKYGTTVKTEFQKYIRLKKNEIITFVNSTDAKMLYDHRPLKLSKDDYQRVCCIPKKKGANFRNLPGVVIGVDNKVELDSSVEREMLSSGKPLVPDYAISFKNGTSTEPFARLWWDEIVKTVVTRAQPHNRKLLHPLQDRVLTIREIARLQGFPDCYKLTGTVKERYKQVGNAVAVPVAIALGYSFGMACQGLSDDNKPLTRLPFKFPNCLCASTQIEGENTE